MKHLYLSVEYIKDVTATIADHKHAKSQDDDRHDYKYVPRSHDDPDSAHYKLLIMLGPSPH